MKELVPTEVFTCGKCGALLFRKEQLVTHRPLGHDTHFEKKGKVKMAPSRYT